MKRASISFAVLVLALTFVGSSALAQRGMIKKIETPKATALTPKPIAGWAALADYMQFVSGVNTLESLVKETTQQTVKNYMSQQYLDWLEREKIIQKAFQETPQAQGKPSLQTNIDKAIKAAGLFSSEKEAYSQGLSGNLLLLNMNNSIDKVLNKLWSEAAANSYNKNALLKLFFIDLSDNFRRGVNMPLHSEIFQYDPDCSGDLLAENLIYEYATNAIKKDYALALKNLYNFARQYVCMSARQAAYADNYLFEAFKKAYSDAEAAGVANIIIPDILQILFNPFLISYDENKYHFSMMIKLFKENGAMIASQYKPGQFIYDMGVWLRNPESNSLEEQGFEVGFDTDIDPIALVPGEDFVYNPETMTPFGENLKSLMNLKCTPEMMMKAVAKGKMQFGKFMENITDPLMIGMANQSFSITASVGLPDIVGGACGLGGGAGGGGGMVCGPLISSGGSDPYGAACIPSSWALNMPPSAEMGETMPGGGGAGPGKWGGQKVKAMFTKMGGNCGGGLSEGKEETPIEPKYSSSDAMDKYKSEAKESWDENKDKVYNSYENETGQKLTDEQKAAADQYVYDSIDNSTSAPMPGNTGGTTGLAVDEEGNAVYSDITWNSSFVNDTFDPGKTIGKSNESIQTHEAAHAALGHLMGGSGWGKETHHNIIGGAGFAPGPDADYVGCTSSNLQLLNGGYSCLQSKEGKKSICDNILIDCVEPWGGGKDKGEGGSTEGGSGGSGVPYEVTGGKMGSDKKCWVAICYDYYGTPESKSPCTTGGPKIDFTKFPGFGITDPPPASLDPMKMPLGVREQFIKAGLIKQTAPMAK